MWETRSDSPLVTGTFLIATVEGDILVVVGLSVKLGLIEVE